MASARGCDHCRVSSPLHLCLACAAVGCGRNQAAHALRHHEQTGHPLVLEIPSGQVWCYLCDDHVMALKDNDDLGEDEFTGNENEAALDCAGLEGLLPPQGLSNLGNSCYMNAALQALLCVPPLVAYYAAPPSLSPGPQRGGSLTALLAALIADPSTNNLNRLVRAMKEINPQFHGYSQQDAMDFARSLLDCLHEEGLLPNLGDGKRRSERLQQQQKHHPSSSSFIRELFGGRLESRLECVQCGQVSLKSDPFLDLCCPLPTQNSSLFGQLGESLGMGKQLRLELCLEAFFATELLEGADRVKCERCQRAMPARKSLRIEEHPECLIIQLKRFRHDSFFSSKINTAVTIPPRLDLQGHGYRLVSFISHRGTLGGGHYVAYGQREGGQWWEFDDATIRPCGDWWERQQAYTVIYRRELSPRRQRELAEWLPILQSCRESAQAWLPRAWLIRWLHFAAEPTGAAADVSPWLCEHGGVRLDRPNCLTPVPSLLAEHLQRRYNVSVLSQPDPCSLCTANRRELEARRAREAEAVMALDTTSLAAGESWHLIHAGWLSEWTAFKAGDRPDPPGPISNDVLLLKEGQDGILPGLTRGIHYRGINGRVWDYFWEIYGGGPRLLAPTIDIYQATIVKGSDSKNASPSKRQRSRAT